MNSSNGREGRVALRLPGMYRQSFIILLKGPWASQSLDQRNPKSKLQQFGIYNNLAVVMVTNVGLAKLAS